MTEVVTCVHHEKLKKSTHVRKYKVKLHMCMPAHPVKHLLWHLFSARVNSPCRDVPEDEISHLANSRKTFLQSNVCL